MHLQTLIIVEFAAVPNCDPIVQLQAITIRAPSRLHFGFLDMHGGLGRRFGSLGMALAEPAFEIQASPSDIFEVEGEGSDQVRCFAECLFKAQRVKPFGRLKILRAIPRHQGLGSGTQMALSVGHALAKLQNQQNDSRLIASLTGRGRRSGIGIGAFDQGGFLVDGGKSGPEAPPVITARLEFPEAWRVVLVTVKDTQGVHGKTEQAFFEDAPFFSEECAGFLSRLLVMGILPALAAGDFMSFADTLTRLQDKIGDYFSVAQQNRYADPRVRQVLEYFRKSGIVGTGQSSWGPTGFVVVAGIQEAEQLQDLMTQGFPEDFGVQLQPVTADNHGAVITTITET